jgi:hypothetical protein
MGALVVQISRNKYKEKGKKRNQTTEKKKTHPACSGTFFG